MGTLTIVMTVVLLIAWSTAKRIILPIDVMTRYTDKMKQAQSRSKKAQLVKELSKEPRFTEINDKFMKMQAAKDLLKRRYEEQTGKADKNFRR